MQIKLTEQDLKTCAQTNQFNDEYFKTVLEELPEEKQNRIAAALDDLIEAMRSVKRRKNENRVCRSSR
jgi:CRISPR/Cas system-associated protein Csm6